ncbi:MAG: type II/IV secretion system ATPase subunit [Thaumarchaeota archaeon]|nr:type II/IV secretion system ATPase subunit [Nitrososphaerota archaeon]
MKAGLTGSRLRAVVLMGVLVAYLSLEMIGAFLTFPILLPFNLLLVSTLGLNQLSTVGAIAIVIAVVVAVGSSFATRREMAWGNTVAETAEQMASQVTKEEEEHLDRGEVGNLLGEKASKFVDVYPLKTGEFNVYCGISRERGIGGYKYNVVEPELTENQRKQFEEVRKLLVEELDVDLKSIGTTSQAEKFLSDRIKKIVKTYGLGIQSAPLKKLTYYFARDFIRLGKIDPLMLDPLIEDISCDGAKIPVYVWHRDYESIPTNVIFQNDEEVNTFVARLAYLSGKHISLAQPMIDASLPDGSRLDLTYGKEITQRGGNFTIRKFKADPLSIVDLLENKTMNSEIAAYLWYLIEKKLAILVAGDTASGKTTSLNCLSMFIVPGQKVVSVEDTPELSLPHENWVQTISRGGGATSEITLFDLLKNALRQRPDVIIVGEVRGQEAFTLFQSVATGHGGMGTIHADSVQAVINRLTSEPMNIPRSLVGTTLDCIVMQLKLRVGDRSVRRITSVAEVVGHDSRNDQIVVNDVFRWEPESDSFTFSGRSRLYDKIAQRYGLTVEQVRRDIDARKTFLDWLANKKIRSYKEVSEQVRQFYAGPYSMVSKAKAELEAKA